MVPCGPIDRLLCVLVLCFPRPQVRTAFTPALLHSQHQPTTLSSLRLLLRRSLALDRLPGHDWLLSGPT
jgi:hypothetical protein